MNDSDRQQVYELVIMEIICDDRKRGKPERQKNVIYTGQRYNSSYIDEDMSDFAVAFYEIVCGYFWNHHPMLDDKGNLIDWEFAGDSMNSFETIANRTPGAGKTRDDHSPKSEFPEFLRIYRHRWHCLVNFWTLPMETGRMLKGELNKARRATDYMDRYLSIIREEVPFDGNGRKFHNSFSSWNDFVDKEFLREGYLDRNDEIISYSRGTPEEFTQGAIRAMECRAKEISESEYA